MQPTIVIRARAKVLGLRVGQERVMAPNAAVQALLRRGMIEVVDQDQPDAAQVAAVGAPEEFGADGATGDDGAPETDSETVEEQPEADAAAEPARPKPKGARTRG